MRRDLVLPASLVICIALMAVYAAYGTSQSGWPTAQAVSCTTTALKQGLAELPEASGLIASSRSRGVFWSHNDSAQPTLFAISQDGAIVGRLQVANSRVEDWEGVTAAPCDTGTCFFIGDIGDNGRKRSGVTIYRIAEPAVSERTSEPATAYRFTYPDGAQDAEALFAAQGLLYVITKGDNGPVSIYRAPRLDDASVVTFEHVITLTDERSRKGLRVTDAAVSPNGQWLAVRSHDTLWFYRAAEVLAGKPGVALATDLRPIKEPQGEGLAWDGDRTVYLAGEGLERAGGTFARVACQLP